MSKAISALLKAAMIVGTIVGALLLACCPGLFVLGFSPVIHDMLVTALEDGVIAVRGYGADLPYESLAFLIQAAMWSCGFSFLIIGVICVINAILASRTRREPTRKRYIDCIVTGALSTDFSSIAGILGLVSLTREERRKRFEE